VHLCIQQSSLTLVRLKLTKTVFKTSVRTAQKAGSLTAIKTNTLVLYREIIAIRSETNVTHTHTYTRTHTHLYIYILWVEGGTFNVKPVGHKVALEFTKTENMNYFNNINELIIYIYLSIFIYTYNITHNKYG